MVDQLQITEVTSIDAKMLDDLADLLIDVVDDGASIGFLPPLSREEAKEYWESVLVSGVILWAAKFEDKLCGTVQLHLSLKENGTHRAEVAKLMVDTQQRKKGIGRELMTILQSRAKLEDIKLLVLDTRLGDPSNTLYKSLGYVEVGKIPNYAKSADGKLEATVFYYKEI
ncbi:GNAT family N-acetyltransferase [Bacillus thuringiensis]|uniref:GNAT family N-acetyltransferase n=1 Tax=Bacillus thuringiensis TaxID=1428 RepID=UPI000BF6E80A|nr:GNAT family N-acetyltransferase [Bacillus thuringiensis]PFE92827.1 GNAT family N-acetyltransferase [Bacillus thuringiensis]